MTSSPYSVHNPFQCNPSMHELLLLVFNLSDPPEYSGTPPVQFTQLMAGAPFTLNCTPSAANPPVDTVSIEVDRSPVTIGVTVTVTDNVITIPSVQRSHSGNYSCNVTNTHGSVVIYRNLLVVGVCTAYCLLVKCLICTSVHIQFLLF